MLTTDRSCWRRLLFPLFVLMLSLPASAGTNSWPNNQVSGTITFQGAPLAGVTVTAFNTNTNSVTQVTMTDESGNYQLGLPAWINTDGTASADYQIWAIKPGYAFYPSAPPPAEVIRADYTGQFHGNGVTDIAIYFTVIHYVSLPNLQNRSIAGPPLVGANFTAYDGTNPLVSLPPETRGVASTRGAGAPRALVQKGRFTDNQDGTVTDSVTGLIWLKNAGCFNPSLWADALTQVNALASGACGLADGSVAGDWRLPNLNELESVIDTNASNPALSPGTFVNVWNAIYWSSTSYFGGQAGSPNAWAIRMSDGRYMNDFVSNIKTAAYNQVWAVKGSGRGGAVQLQATGQYVTFGPGDDGAVQAGAPLPFPRWIDQGDGTLVDTVTGLVWLKQADCIHQTWQVAAAAVNALASGQCGLSDGSQAGSWHMPSRTELQSLSDRAENNHADFFDSTYIFWSRASFQSWAGVTFRLPIFNNLLTVEYYWTSTPDAADSTKVWTVYSCDFGVYDTPKSNTGYALAVRSPNALPIGRGAGLLRGAGVTR